MTSMDEALQALAAGLTGLQPGGVESAPKVGDQVTVSGITFTKIGDEPFGFSAATGELAPANASRPAGSPAERLDKTEMDHLVGEWLDERAAAEKHAGIASDAAAVIATKLRPGEKWEVVPGVGCQIRRPSRSFSQALANELLTDDDRQACLAFSWTVARALLKARGQEDACMVPGTGNGTVAML